MSRAEKAFWAGLLLATGMILGAVMVSLTQVPKKADCDNGISEQLKDGVMVKTYMPALDTCKDQK